MARLKMQNPKPESIRHYGENGEIRKKHRIAHKLVCRLSTASDT